MSENSNRPSAPPPGTSSRTTSGQAAQPEATPVEVRAASAGVTRRQVLRTAMYGTVGTFFSSSLVGAGVMFWPAKVSGFGGKVVVPQKLSEIEMGDAPLKVREGKFFLSRLPEGVIALYWKCPHLGCTVPWNDGEDKFHCPCHGSIYERTGQNVGGPAPRPMDYMAVEILEDQIVVDTSKITQRPVHNPDHVTRLKA